MKSNGLFERLFKAGAFGSNSEQAARQIFNEEGLGNKDISKHDIDLWRETLSIIEGLKKERDQTRPGYTFYVNDNTVRAVTAELEKRIAAEIKAIAYRLKYRGAS